MSRRAAEATAAPLRSATGTVGSGARALSRTRSRATNTDRDRVALVLAAALSASAFVVIAWRLKRGLDYTDEAFYLSLPFRFALGDQPFVHELNIAQTAGLLLFPFVKVYVALRGTTGIFLFARTLYLAFFACVGVSAYALGRTRLPRHTALLAGTPCIAFFPYAIPGLGYNTLGTGLLAIGLFVATREVVSPRADAPTFLKDPFSWSGFALAASTFAYPSLVVGAVIATGAVFLLMTGRRLGAAVRMVLGAGMFAFVLAPVFVAAGPSHLRATMAYSMGTGLGSQPGKLDILWDQFLAQHPETATMAIALGAAIALARRWPRLVALALPFLVLLAHGNGIGPTTTSIGYVASLSIIGPPIAIALKDSRAALRLLAGVWAPSAACGAAMAWTSGNGVVAAGVGLFPAAVVSVILLAIWIAELARGIPAYSLRSLVGFAPALAAWALIKLTMADNHVYRDAALPQLTAVVSDGPYKGLLTTPVRAHALAQTSNDILARRSAGRMLFYYDFPAGYLVASRRPNVPSTWLFAMEPRMSMDAAGFARDARRGDVVFKMEAMAPGMNTLDRVVTSRSDKVGEREGYTVWVVR